MIKIKTLPQIYNNYASKLGAWMTGSFREDKLKQHIQILDWVLSNEPHTRGIDEILKSPIKLQNIPENDKRRMKK